MFARSRFSTPKTAVYAALVVVQATCGLCAQNFTARSANLNPFGVNGPLPFGKTSDFGGGLAVKGGFNSGISLSSTYNSNVLLSENDPESDVTLSVSPTLSYTSDPEGGAKMVLSANYAPSGNVSLNNSDYNSFDQSGSVAMIISGSRTTISAFAGISQDSGADSLAVSQGFFTGTAVSLGLQAGYQLAPRTSISAGWSSSITDYGDGTGIGTSTNGPGNVNSGNSPADESSGEDSAVGFNGYSVNIGGSWAATERFSFGPSLTYSTSSSDNTGDFDTWGFSMMGSYKVSERIQVAASIGVQYSDYSQEGASTGLSPTGSLNANYQINELWSWSGSIQSGLTPSPTGTNLVINGWSLASSLSRQLLIGSVGFGVNMDFSNFESAGPTGFSQASQEDQQNIGLLLNYSRPLFNDRVGFSTSLIYSLNYGDIEWTQIQLNAGLNMAF